MTLLDAAALLGCAVSVFLLSAMLGLAKLGEGAGSQRDMRLALIGLGIAAMLGLAVHALALAVLLAAVILGIEWLARLAGLLVLVEFAWLGLNMLGVLTAYRKPRSNTHATSCRQRSEAIVGVRLRRPGATRRVRFRRPSPADEPGRRPSRSARCR